MVQDGTPRPGPVARLTRKEMLIRVIALVLAGSFLATALLAFFYGSV